MRGTNQGGSLAGFIIVGVLLALVLIGGLYGLNRYNAQRAADEVATETSEQEKNAADDRQRTSNESEEKRAEPTTTPTADPGDKAAPSSAPAQSGSQTATRTANLPQSGPADTALTLIVLGAVTFAGAHYVRSRSQR